MPRLVLRILAVLLTLGVLVLPTLGAVVDESGDTHDPVTITSHDASYTVDRDGTLHAHERVTAAFPSGRHGIFRYWDVTDPDDAHVRYIPEDIAVRLDGHAVPVDYSWKHTRRFRVAKIGDPDETLSPGQHVFDLTYRVDGALSDAGFAWRVVAPGWQNTIEQSRTTVALPRAPRSVVCRTAGGVPCDVEVDGRTATITTGALRPPRTGVTVAAPLDTSGAEQSTLPWSVTWDTSLGRSVPLLVAAVLLGVVTFAVGFVWERRSRENPPGTPVLFEPPTGLGPAQTAYVAGESVPESALTATLLHLAETGLVRLERDGEHWTITGAADEAAWQSADVVARAVGEDLGVTTRDASFAADGSVEAGKTLQALKLRLPGVVRTWAEESGTVVVAGGERLGRTLVPVALGLAGLLLFVAMQPSWYTLPFLGFVVGAAGLWAPGVGTRRTATGRDLWSRAAGFRRLITTDSAESRFDFSGRKDLYTAFVPYAVAFGAADVWARKYERATGTTAPVAAYYGATGGGYSSSADVTSSFDAALSSSIGAYAATQSSSSGGGGGFGGGGGGGGGGGSW